VRLWAHVLCAVAAIACGSLLTVLRGAVDRLEAKVEDAIYGERVHVRGSVVAGSFVARGDRVSFAVDVGGVLFRVEAPRWIVPDTIDPHACASAATSVEVEGRRRSDRVIDAARILGRASSCRRADRKTKVWRRRGRRS